VQNCCCYFVWVNITLDGFKVCLLHPQLDSLKYLRKCVSYYGPDRMADHAEDIWHSLETILFNKEDDQIAKEALECLETTVSVLITPNRDTFFGLICQNVDFVLKNVASEKQAELHAIGSIFSVISRVSDYLCTRLFQQYFARLVNTLVEPTQSSLNGKALYLVFEILSSCRGLTQNTDSSDVISEKDSWLNILRNYTDELTAALLKLVNAATNFKEDALKASQDNVLRAGNQNFLRLFFFEQLVKIYNGEQFAKIVPFLFSSLETLIGVVLISTSVGNTFVFPMYKRTQCM
jgi:hypothetical protein